MTSINNPYLILLLMFSSTLILFASALDLSGVATEAPTSSDDGFLPFAKKHVVIRNHVSENLNVHCKSSEDDLGLIHIPFMESWSFKFRVNFWKTTKFRCHFTWSGGGSHYFDIFKVSRDDNPSGHTPPCRECIWELGNEDRHDIDTYYICRLNRDESDPYCFRMDDNP